MLFALLAAAHAATCNPTVFSVDAEEGLYDGAIYLDNDGALRVHRGAGCASWEIATDCPRLVYDEHGEPLVLEGDSGSVGVRFDVTLDAPASTEVWVNYATRDLTASAGSDYGATSGTLIFPVGDTIQTVVVPVYGDTVIEGDEQFALQLSLPSGAQIADDEAVGEIAEDDVWYYNGVAFPDYIP